MIRSRTEILTKLSAGIYDFSPVVIIGESGTGKTYFAKKLCNVLRDNGLVHNYNIKPAWEFTQSMIEALTNHEMNTWRKQFASSEIIVLDDLQYLSQKSASSEELYQFLCSVDVPVVITSSVPPTKEFFVCSDLVAYMSAGTHVNLNETLRTDTKEYLQSCLSDHSVNLTNEAMDWLLQQELSTIAMVKGIVRTLELYQESSNTILDITESQKLLESWLIIESK